MKDMKIKLVAIAKDEAAYISEWIFHHLHFGFDEIEVYVNFTTDPTYEILRKIGENHPVKYKNAEYLLSQEYDLYDQVLQERYLNRNRLQSRAYAEALDNARKNNFTHIMFLDIDEFWTPSCFKKKINKALESLSDPSGVSFVWKNKVKEEKLFERPFQDKVYFLHKSQVKSIIKTDRVVKIMNSHYSTYLASDEKTVIDPRGKNIADDIRTAFILHRFQRSETEYISMLGRGDPTCAGKFNLKFTRSGYQDGETSSELTLDVATVKEYDNKYQKFVKENLIEENIEEGKKFVLTQKKVVLDYIKDNIKIYSIIKKITPGLSLNDDDLTNLNTTKSLNDLQINMIKDVALEYENKDLRKAYELMKVVYIFKPHSPFISRKLKKYKSLLKIEN